VKSGNIRRISVDFAETIAIIVSRRFRVGVATVTCPRPESTMLIEQISQGKPHHESLSGQDFPPEYHTSPNTDMSGKVL
jgi:hypothetical protein